MASRTIIGSVTRGTTNTNRLRRIDRWIAAQRVFRTAPDPLVVDLGYGASGVTTFELAHRLQSIRRDVDVVGIEIEPGRVELANRQLSDVRAGLTPFAPDLRASFVRGGFEIPVAGGRRPAIIRALNVLRQYDESEVVPAWRELRERLQPDGLIIDGTCDEIGRVCSWVGLDPEGPATFTISLRLPGLERPSIVAERLPKILIHRNVEGERIHRLLAELDRLWQIHSALATYGPRQRWLATIIALRDAGWPVLGGRTRWKLGEVSLPWSSVAPLSA